MGEEVALEGKALWGPSIPISYFLNVSFKKEGVCHMEWDPRDWVFRLLLMTLVIKGQFLFYCR